MPSGIPFTHPVTGGAPALLRASPPGRGIARAELGHPGELISGRRRWQRGHLTFQACWSQGWKIMREQEAQPTSLPLHEVTLLPKGEREKEQGVLILFPSGGKGRSFMRNSLPSSSGFAGSLARQAPRAGSPDPAPSIPPSVRALLARMQVCLRGTGHHSGNCPSACGILRPGPHTASLGCLQGPGWQLPASPQASLVQRGSSCARWLCKITDSKGFPLVSSSSVV